VALLKKLIKIALALAVLGLIIAFYQTAEHYFLSESICDLSETFSCSVVTESKYGELPFNSGISLALWGSLWWIALIILLYRLKKPLLKNQEFYIWLMVITGMAFVIYLVAVEVYFLPLETGEVVICPLCTIQHILILLLLPISWKLLKKPLVKYVDTLFKYITITAILIAIPGFFMLSPSPEVDHWEFTECLANKDATMYGFYLCPNCNKQEHLLGYNAFKKNIEGTGRYVLCRPEEEAIKPIGDRINKISVLEKYKDQINEKTTQGELCSLMVGEGTPTWIINDQQVSGWQTIKKLSEMSGCEIN
jgi:uncharacterized membrane protein